MYTLTDFSIAVFYTDRVLDTCVHCVFDCVCVFVLLFVQCLISQRLAIYFCGRSEIEDLQQRVLRERDQYQAATQSAFPGISAVPFFSVNDKVIYDSRVAKAVAVVEVQLDLKWTSLAREFAYAKDKWIVQHNSRALFFVVPVL